MEDHPTADIYSDSNEPDFLTSVAVLGCGTISELVCDDDRPRDKKHGDTTEVVPPDRAKRIINDVMRRIAGEDVRKGIPVVRPGKPGESND